MRLVGSVVHYVNLGDADGKYPPEVQAAIITRINKDGTADLKIFYRTGIFDCHNVKFSETHERGKWTDAKGEE